MRASLGLAGDKNTGSVCGTLRVPNGVDIGQGYVMTERLSDLEQKLRSSRSKLEALAERAAQLRIKLEADTALVSSMEKLAELAKRAPNPLPKDDFQEDDGFYLSDGWEIELANEEGK